MKHELKTINPYFNDVDIGCKTFYWLQEVVTVYREGW